MATRYFLKDTNAQTTCDTSGPNSHDLSKTQGTPTTVIGINVSGTPFVDVLEFDLDVTADTPITGTHDVSISVNTISSGSTARFRVEVIDDAGCTDSVVSAWSSTFTTNGIKTMTTGSLTWGAGDERLRVTVQQSRNSGQHGNKTITLDVNHASSYIDAPWTVSGGARRIFTT